MNLNDYPYLANAYRESQNLAAARVMDVVLKNYNITPSFKGELESAIENTHQSELELIGPIHLNQMTEAEEQYLETILAGIADEINEKVLTDDPTKTAVAYRDKGRFCMEIALDEHYNEMKRPYVESEEAIIVRAEQGNPEFGHSRINETARGIIGRGYIKQYEVKRLQELISDHMLCEWAPSFRRVEINTFNNLGSSISYNIAPLTETTAIQMMSGEKTMNDIIRGDNVIRMKISESTFNNLRSPKKLYEFLERCVRLYTEEIPEAGDDFTRTLVTSPMEYKLTFSSPEMLGHLESTILQLFSYQGFDINDLSDLHVTTEDVYALSSMYTNVPETTDVNELKKQKSHVLSAFEEDAKVMYIDRMRINSILESLENVYSEKSVQLGREKMRDWLLTNSKTIQPMTEAWGRKKKRLKKIPMSTIAYVQVEGENIRDANDKYMIAAYCLGKIELVEWYIELLQSDSEKYEVPHDLKYLERMRTSLLAAYKTIMSRPIPKADRPILDIKYPEDLPMGK